MPSLLKNGMLQRIQSIYLLVVVILMAVLPVWLPLWVNTGGENVFAIDKTFIFIAYLVSALLAFGTIFLFKNRKLQFVLNRLNMILNVTLLGFFVYWSLNLSGETEISKKGIAMFIPVISIVLLVLSNKAIKKDEDLVKSVDRLR